MFYHFCLLFLLANMAIADLDETCRRSENDELIWEYQIRRPYITGKYQEMDAEYGPSRATITCIDVKYLAYAERGRFWIVAGGVGQNFVKLRFRSMYSRGLRCKILMYGRKTNQ